MRSTPTPPSELAADWPSPTGARLALPQAGRDDLAAVRAHVARGCQGAGMDATGSEALVLAADEVCANIVMHAYGCTPGPLSVDLSPLPDGGCAVTIVDAGPPFDPTMLAASVDTDAPLDERQIGGLGWHLVRQSVDKLRYTRVAAHNVVVLERRAPAPSSLDSLSRR